MCLTDLSGKLADQAQSRRVRQVVHYRLADDRDQDECRYIMRFWWQLTTSCSQVTLEQLRAHVHGPKLAAIEGLVEAIRSSSEDVEAWIAIAEETFPIVFDRGAYVSLGMDDPSSRNSDRPGHA